FLIEHDLFGKPVPTFPDHAEGAEFRPNTPSGNTARALGRESGETMTNSSCMPALAAVFLLALGPQASIVARAQSAPAAQVAPAPAPQIVPPRAAPSPQALPAAAAETPVAPASTVAPIVAPTADAPGAAS